MMAMAIMIATDHPKLLLLLSRGRLLLRIGPMKTAR